MPNINLLNKSLNVKLACHCILDRSNNPFVVSSEYFTGISKTAAKPPEIIDAKQKLIKTLLDRSDRVSSLK